MDSFRISNVQTRSIVAVAVLLLASIVPALASAAQVTERSITLSSSSKNADDVEYTVKFTAPQAAGAFVIDFCSNTPLIGEDCTPPTGLDVSSADASGDYAVEAGATANKLVITSAITQGEAVSAVLTDIDNPSVTGTMYARILTYTNTAGANGYVSDDIDAVAAPWDQGSVAMSITETIGVTGAVLESMTFCVSKVAPTVNCGGVTPPTLPLGQNVGDGVLALSDTVSSGSIFTQISTNAAGGAIVNLKSNATSCGGLLLAGGQPGNCFISPAVSDILTGEAEFGVKTATAAGVGGESNGTLQPRAPYNNTTYAMNAATNNSTGVTSTYGDPFLDTDDDPVNDMNMELTFGAQINNSTPAGKYSADLSLIATGKF